MLPIKFKIDGKVVKTITETNLISEFKANSYSHFSIQIGDREEDTITSLKALPNKT